ncbi:hypothetical protein G6F32_016467 [Rhizopus arrhizus]|nr:hypothetical protein G6F32_016467 [Rhizopus arrhizus]
MPRRAQQVRDQRGGGALALGAGHAHGVVHDAVVGRVFGKPQRGAADDDTQPAHGRSSRGRGRAEGMGGPVLGQMRLSEHGAGPGGMGVIRYFVTL